MRGTKIVKRLKDCKTKRCKTASL